MSNTEVSIIIVSYNTCELLHECVQSVLRFTKQVSYDIRIIDNASTDTSVAMIKKLQSKHSFIHLVQNKKNVGFGLANNIGILKSKAKYILLLNSDTLLHSDVISNIVSYMNLHDDVGVSTCRLQNIDKTTQATGGYFPTLLNVFVWMTIQDLPFIGEIVKPFHPRDNISSSFYQNERELDWVTGAFFFLRRDAVSQSGLFDPDYFMYTEETDLCYRIKKHGWKIMYLPSHSITHYGGASSKKWSFVLREFNGVKLFFKKHRPSWNFPLVRLSLKLGAALRFIAYLILARKEAAKAYAQAMVYA
jgi:GT2 family glycosyltransferase